jgi:hypothetical protein
MDYALVKDGLVQNVIVAEPDFIPLIQAEWDHIEALDTLHEQGIGVSRGWSWDAVSGFAPPPAPPAPPPEPEKRHITVGAFFDRFAAEKYAILASDDALVKAMVTDASVRKFIDLDRPDLLQGLMLVQSKGFAIDPQAIVLALIQPGERP